MLGNFPVVVRIMVSPNLSSTAYSGSANDLPVVSICIPTFNNADMIEEAIGSVLKQTYRRLEIWVMDNCSTDETEVTVRKIAAKDPRMHYVRHSRNIGMANNFNACLASATGEFVMILGADDLLEEECIEKLVIALSVAPDAVLAACGRQYVDETLHPLKVLRKTAEFAIIDGLTLIRECVALGNQIGEPSAVLFKLASARRGFNPEFSQFLDLEMWFFLLNGRSGVFLPEPLSLIRQHPRQTSKGNFQSGRLIEEKRHLFTAVFSPARNRLTIVSKVMWDLRMVISVARFRLYGGRIKATKITEVFYRPLYLFLLLGMHISLPFAQRLKAVKGM
jgi:glycosyltransferase involved in cell wall biosynthesis